MTSSIVELERVPEVNNIENDMMHGTIQYVLYTYVPRQKVQFKDGVPVKMGMLKIRGMFATEEIAKEYLNMLISKNSAEKFYYHTICPIGEWRAIIDEDEPEYRVEIEKMSYEMSHPILQKIMNGFLLGVNASRDAINAVHDNKFVETEMWKKLEGMNHVPVDINESSMQENLQKNLNTRNSDVWKELDERTKSFGSENFSHMNNNSDGNNEVFGRIDSLLEHRDAQMKKYKK